MNKKIALITYKEFEQLAQSDQQLQTSLEKEGINAVPICWDDPHVDWKTFDLLVIRSCWDYHERLPEFLSWIDMLETHNIQVQNVPSLIRWNSDKKYLIELIEKGVDVVPSVLVKQGSQETIVEIMNRNHWKQAIIKPTVGASGSGVFYVREEEAGTKQWKMEKLLENSDCIIQTFVEEVKNGEISMVFINGHFSHSVLKTPKANDFRVNYAFGGTVESYSPSNDVIITGEHVLKILPSIPLYARVDGIMRNNLFTLMELELIEPNLFFDTRASQEMPMVKAIIDLL